MIFGTNTRPGGQNRPSDDFVWPFVLHQHNQVTDFCSFTHLLLTVQKVVTFLNLLQERVYHAEELRHTIETVLLCLMLRYRID